MRKFVNFFIHYFGTTKHKFWVSYYLFRFCMCLFWRMITHDLSKYLPSEAKGFIKVIHRLKHLTYGSDEYKESLKSIKPSIDLHYKRNYHHPEHYGAGVTGMNLIDIVEMWCDWKAAVRRHKDGDITKSIKNNEERFLMDKQLTTILYNQSIIE